MAANLPPRWARRLVGVPSAYVLFVLLLSVLPWWLVVAAFVSRFVPGRWRAFRLAWFAIVWLALEVVALTVLFGLWLWHGFGWTLSSEASLDRHHRLLAWILRRLMGSATFTFGLAFSAEGDPVDVADLAQPVLVLSRHAGAGDSLLVMHGIVNGPHRRRPHVVLKDLLQFDPVIDVLLNRLGASFVPSGGRAGEATVAEIGRLAARAGPRDAVLIFPEGANFTPRRRRRAIAQLRRIGRPDLVERAEALGHLLPPKPLGVDTALTAAPGATVVFVGHAGLESMSTPRDIWRNLPMDHTITTRAWQWPAGSIPPAPARETWLYDQWEEIDEWVQRSLAAQAERRAELAAAPPRPLRTVRETVFAAPSLGPMAGALVAWSESLRPSMLPRSWLVQGLVSAICALAGFGVGGLAQALARRVLILKGGTVPPRWRAGAETALTTAGLVSLVVGPWLWWRWQQDQRDLVSMPTLPAWSVAPMLTSALAFTLALLALARVVKHAATQLDRAAARRLPVAWARKALVAIGVIVILAASGLTVRGFTDWADQSFGALDGTTAEGASPPAESTSSGGPGSLIAWEDLGFMGRSFVAEAPTRAQLAASATLDDAARATPATTPMTPIRVYVGLRSAATVADRVALAVAELRRSGAFDRQVLVVATPTGTGWVDPDGARTIEHLYRGNTAIVAVQYSFLPSWIAFLLDTVSPQVLGQALFQGVHAAWAELPQGRRPKLVAFGESLGAFGAEAPFVADGLSASLRRMTSQVDAALFTGPTADNPVFSAIVAGRDPGSPTWRPTVAAEPHLRVANRGQDIPATDPRWARPRVLYVHHPSDAIGTWSPATLWRAPGWGDDPPAYDLPGPAGWFPVVSFAQETFDLLNGFSASPGHGHDYRTDFVRAWAAVLPPPDWTARDSDRLAAHLGL